MFAGRKGLAAFALLVLLVTVVALSPTALASPLRVYALGGATWLVEDDTSHFVNPALSAWADQGYILATGVVNPSRLNQVDTSQMLQGRLYFVLPVVKSSGLTDVLGGLARWTNVREDIDSRTYPYVSSDNQLQLYLQNAVRIGSKLALGGVLYYSPGPASRDVFYDDGRKHLYKDQGSGMYIGSGLALRPNSQTTVGMYLQRYAEKNIVQASWDGVYDAANSYTASYAETLLSAQADLAISESMKVAARLDYRSWSGKARDGNSYEGTYLVPAVGLTKEVGHRLYIVGAVSADLNLHSAYNDFFLRGGAEYRLTDWLTLRGGLVGSLDNGGRKTLELTTGFGASLGPGTFDAYLLPVVLKSPEYPAGQVFQVGYMLRF